SDFYRVATDGLGRKLGCVLFQFPADYTFREDRLLRITGLLDSSVTNVLEFRHASWWNDTVFETLKRANVSFCGMSHPSLPDEVMATTDTIYYRFHGVPHLYQSRYETAKLEQVVQDIQRQGGRRAFVFFNNTAEGHAITNAKQLQEICEFVH